MKNEYPNYIKKKIMRWKIRIEHLNKQKNELEIKIKEAEKILKEREFRDGWRKGYY